MTDIALLPTPRWRVLSWMAALSRAAGLSAELYLTELVTCIALRAIKGDD
jgi:hypothetical protein